MHFAALLHCLQRGHLSGSEPRERGEEGWRPTAQYCRIFRLAYFVSYGKQGHADRPCHIGAYLVSYMSTSSELRKLTPAKDPALSVRLWWGGSWALSELLLTDDPALLV